MTRAALLMLAGLCPTSIAIAAGAPLAVVDGQPITVDDLEQDFGRRHSGHVAFLAGEEEIRRALDAAIDRVLLLHEAERLELYGRPEVAEAGDDLARRLALEHLLRTEISEPAQPSEDEIRAAWQEYADELYRVRQIVVAERTEADELARRLKAGEPFEILARERSQAASGRDGGRLPPIRWGSLGAAWDEVVTRLDVGEVSVPFWNGGGWEIVEMLERLPVPRPEYLEARELIKGALLRANVARLQQSLSERLFTQYGVQIARAFPDAASLKAATAADSGAVVATWRGGRLELGELLAEVDLDALAGLTGERARRELDGQVRTSINQRLAALEAEARGYAREPEIREAIRRYRDEAMEAILHGEFIFRGVDVAEHELRAWFEANRDQLATPERRQVAQILVATEDEARVVAGRLAAGEAFAELARESSIDRESGPRGGFLGWISPSELPPGFGPIFELEEGETSPPLQTELGWHLIRVLAVEAPRERSFDEAADEVRRKLLRDKRRAARDRWVEQLRAAAEISIDEATLGAYVAEAVERE